MVAFPVVIVYSATTRPNDACRQNIVMHDYCCFNTRAHLDWGKFYEDDDDFSVSAEHIRQPIRGYAAQIGACVSARDRDFLQCVACRGSRYPIRRPNERT